MYPLAVMLPRPATAFRDAAFAQVKGWISFQRPESTAGALPRGPPAGEGMRSPRKQGARVLARERNADGPDSVPVRRPPRRRVGGARAHGMIDSATAGPAGLANGWRRCAPRLPPRVASPPDGPDPPRAAERRPGPAHPPPPRHGRRGMSTAARVRIGGMRSPRHTGPGRRRTNPQRRRPAPPDHGCRHRRRNGGVAAPHDRDAATPLCHWLNPSPPNRSRPGRRIR
ncbi:hypothetical protein GCM10010123_25700 [Pilimelia anulata]|uniref:Uncharacterized protein n=1 Tax=Pilimelia anulata TaxID=53371 RepID=A0A8J3FB27_9ACTN|nr:hypothetical protein GCM10010123_25700 [Pilimelia anulata]